MPAPATPPSRPGAPAAGPFIRSIRRRSDYEYLGMPLWSIALGPDPTRGELRGHAKGVLAIGDIATGIVAFGGLARGVFAVGGLAAGVFAFGGLALGGVAFGGAAIGLLALGGGALGAIAIGGAALGYYASGGAAFGAHVVGALGQDPEAIAFFAQWGWLRELLQMPRR